MRSDLETLWHEVFNDSYQWIRKLAEERDLETYEHLIDGKAVSALHLFDINFIFNDRTYCAKYLIGAATYAGYRNRGLMSGLLKKAVSDHREGIFLYPAVRPFYHNLGFLSPIFRLVGGGIKEEVEYDYDPDIAYLDYVYRTCFNETGCLLKDERAWRGCLEDNHVAITDGAYAMVSKETGKVSECAFVDEKGLDWLTARFDSIFIPCPPAEGGGRMAGMTSLGNLPQIFIPEIY